MTTGIDLAAALSALCPDCLLGVRARAEFVAERPEVYVSLLMLPFALVGVAALLIERLGEREP